MKSRFFQLLNLVLLSVLLTIPANGKESTSRSQTREFTVQKKYLVMPIAFGKAPKSNLSLFIDDVKVRGVGIHLASSKETTGWYAIFTIDQYKGKTATVTVSSASDETFDLIQQSDVIPDEEKLFKEPWRPQFHYTQRVGWINDPNGMVYHDGTWHFFYQHNPVSRGWGNMTWGHATTKDLLHWEHQGNKLYNGISTKGPIFSGGGTVDKKNAAGFGENAIMLFYTNPNQGENMAYSTDGGRTFTPYEGNPILLHKKPFKGGRDPKVIWYAYGEDDVLLNEEAGATGGHWVMAVYAFADSPKGEHSPKDHHFTVFYTSNNLTDWTYQSKLPGFFECPELLELPVDGDPNNTRWVTYGGNTSYVIGDFDGKTFTPDHEGQYLAHHGFFYASQTFDNAPDNRRIQIGWASLWAPKVDTPKESAYNRHFSFPYELTLRTTSKGVRLRANPIEEIENLRVKSHQKDATDLGDGESVIIAVGSSLLDVSTTIDLGNAKTITLQLPGRTVTYDATKQQLNEKPLKPVDGKIAIRVLVDRSLTEVFGNDGEAVVVGLDDYKPRDGEVKLTVSGGSAKLVSLEAHELKSIWNNMDDITGI